MSYDYVGDVLSEWSEKRHICYLCFNKSNCNSEKKRKFVENHKQKSCPDFKYIPRKKGGCW